MFSRIMIVMFILTSVGCTSATYIRAKVVENPLDRVVQQAQTDWSIERIDANNLALSDAWPIHSIFSLGYSASHANLYFDSAASELNIRYYFQINALGFLFISGSPQIEVGK